jgi:spore coat protein U-like protein
VSYTIQLNAGSSGSFSPRKLASGANLLNYNLYTTSARTTIWGNGSGGTSTVGGSFTLGNCTLLLLCSDETESRNHTAYGRIPASQNVPAGSYSDTITVTVNY